MFQDVPSAPTAALPQTTTRFTHDTNRSNITNIYYVRSNTYANDFPLKGTGGATADQTQNSIWIWKGQISLATNGISAIYAASNVGSL